MVTLSNSSGGTFRLAFGGETTYALDEDATAGEVEAAFEELNTVDDVSVSGSAGGPWTVTFGGDQAGEDQPTIAGDAATLTSGTLARTISYAYDAAGQLVSASDPDSEYAYTYDNLGRVLTVDNDGTPGVPQVVLTSAYDAAGNRTSLSATVDSTADFLNTYTYDGLHRLTQVTQEEQSGGNSVVDKRVDYAYNAASQYTSIARYNDVAGGSGAEIATSVFSYDTIGRLSDLAHQQGSTDLFTPYEWTYDGLSRITQIVSADGTSDYTYDETSQLTAADYDFQTDESYSYDANGNRTMTGYSTGDNNQLLSDGTYDYTYDDEGNRLTRTNTSTYESTEYTWDQRNRLIRVEDKDSMSQTVQVVEYIYDVFNRRIGRAVDTTSSFDMADAAIERYVLDDVNGVASLDGGNVVLDFVDPDGDGTDPIELNRRYLFGNAVDQLLAQENVTESTSAAARVDWPLTDHLGTVRDLVKNDGTLGEHYTYTAYGQVASGDTSMTRFLFTGRELDEATGLQYNRARWYDAVVGRWVSEDPLGFGAGDGNVVRYAFNASNSVVDPSGLAPPSAIQCHVPANPGYGPVLAPPLLIPAPAEDNRPWIVIVTGFGKFGPYVDDAKNPSNPFALAVAQELKENGVNAVGIAPVPVNWGEMDKLIEEQAEKYKDHQIIWIAFGAGPSKDKFHLELVADNKRLKEADMSYQVPGRDVLQYNDPLAPFGSKQNSRLGNRAGWTAIALLLQDFPIVLSNEAHDFVCESTAFNLHKADGIGMIAEGVFIHTPEKLDPLAIPPLAKTFVGSLFSDGMPVPGLLIPSERVPHPNSPEEYRHPLDGRHQ